MKVNIKRINSDFKMDAVNETGNHVTMDGSLGIGGAEEGFRPMQLLLAAVGGCSAIDVISILKKQKQQIDSFEIEVDGNREAIDDYSVFKKIEIHFILTGEVEKEKAEKAIQLSLNKYCSVSKTLEAHAQINYKLTVNGK